MVEILRGQQPSVHDSEPECPTPWAMWKCSLPVPAGKQRIEHCDQVQSVIHPVAFPPRWVVHAVLDDGLMKVALGKAVEGEGHQPHWRPGTGQVPAVAARPAAVAAPPGAASHNPIPIGRWASDPLLDGQGVSAQILRGPLQIGARMDVRAVC